jgi:UDP-N-acetylglucosamine acyltransferase
MNDVHPTAVIAATAELGADVSVGPYAVIEDDVIIGDRCRIEAHAVIRRYTRMGGDNRIHPHAMVGGEPQDLKFRGEVSWLEIGSHNVIREFASLHRGTAGGGGVTRLGDHNLCMASTHIAHDCQIGSHIVMSNLATLAGHVSVDDHAIIGGVTGIHQFVRLGRHSFVGGMTGIGMDLPPWMLASGARGTVQGPNIIGLRRAGAGAALLRAMKEAHRLVWRSGLPRSEALDQLEQAHGELPEVQEFLAFVHTSERGVLAGGKGEDDAN